eukprot:3893783-Pleurochrysis_carterae.AAC.1
MLLRLHSIERFGTPFAEKKRPPEPSEAAERAANCAQFTESAEDEHAFRTRRRKRICFARQPEHERTDTPNLLQHFEHSARLPVSSTHTTCAFLGSKGQWPLPIIDG